MKCGLCMPNKPCNSENCLDDVQAEINRAVKDFYHKHNEMVECLVCHAIKAGIPVDRIEIVEQITNTGRTISLRMKELHDGSETNRKEKTHPDIY